MKTLRSISNIQGLDDNVRPISGVILVHVSHVFGAICKRFPNIVSIGQCLHPVLALAMTGLVVNGACLTPSLSIVVGSYSGNVHAMMEPLAIMLFSPQVKMLLVMVGCVCAYRGRGARS